MAGICCICNKKLGAFVKFGLKDGTVCSGCYDKIYYIIKTLKLKKKVSDFTEAGAKELLKNFDIAKEQSAGMRRVVDSENPDENGMLKCAYCQNPMKKGFTHYSMIKQGRICNDCSNRFHMAQKYVPNAPKSLTDYTIKDLDLLFSEYEKYKSDLPNEKRTAIEDEEKNSSKGLGQFFRELRDDGLKRKADKAIEEAYKEEQEKRKPHIKRVAHQRPLTPEEQLSIDMIDAEIIKYDSEYYKDYWTGPSEARTVAFGQKYAYHDKMNKKKQEIISRSIWYEEFQVPPEIDPNVPIHVDEDAIRRQIYGDRYQIIIEQNK